MKAIILFVIAILVLTVSLCDSTNIKSTTNGQSESEAIHNRKFIENVLQDTPAKDIESISKYEHAYFEGDSLVLPALFNLRNEGIPYTLDYIEVGKDIPPGEYVVTYHDGRVPFWNMIINGVKHEEVSSANKIYVSFKDGYIIEAEGYAFTPKDKYNGSIFDDSPNMAETLDLEELIKNN